MKTNVSFTLANLADHLETQRCLIITANHRLKRFILSELASYNTISGPAPSDMLKVIGAEQVVTFDEWLQYCWDRLQDIGYPETHRVRMENEHERFIWQRLVDQETQNSPLLNTRALAKYLQEARSIAHQWHISETELSEQGKNVETEFLLSMCAKYSKYIEDKALISQDRVIELVSIAFNTGELGRYDKILPYGFANLSPAYEDLFTCAADSCEGFSIQTSSRNAIKYEAKDSDDEIRQAAAWSKSILDGVKNRQPGTDAKNLQPKIGIIVPDLSSRKPAISADFIKTFRPDHFSSINDFNEGLPFDFSIGEPLGATAIVKDTFILLSLRKSHLEVGVFIDLCLSPFWGDADSPARIKMVEWLKSLSAKQISCSVFISRFKNVEEAFAAINADVADSILEDNPNAEPFEQDSDAAEEKQQWQTLSAAREIFKHLHRGFSSKEKRQDTLGQLTEQFQHALKTLAWPGTNILNSPEYQALKRFFDLFDEHCNFYSRLDALPTSLDNFLNELESRAYETIFHLQTETKPIQIMGLMEGAGMKFDYCWIAGAVQDKLPSPPTPNPLIPLAIQRQKGTPKSSHEHELMYAKTLVDEFKSCASEVVFSYPQHSEESPSEPSSLIADIPFAEDTFVGANAYTSVFSEYCHAEAKLCSALDYRPESDAPKIAEGSQIVGGTGHLKLHAINPRYAFFVYRLGLRQHGKPALGLSGSDRGTILHEILAEFWLKVGNKENLERIIDSNQLEQELLAIAETITSRFANKKHIFMSEEQQILEHKRSVALCSLYCEQELTRPNFSVTSVEKTFNIEINKRHISLRADRIDTLEDGQHFIIDYKTASANLTGLQRRPLKEPQLALYCDVDKASSAAIAFAEINRKHVRYLGIGENVAIPGLYSPDKLNKYDLPNTWQEVVSWWQDDLQQTVSEICAGKCPDTTRYAQDALYYSHLSPVLRENTSLNTDNSQDSA